MKHGTRCRLDCSSCKSVSKFATTVLWLALKNEWCFRPRFCTVKAILGRRQPGRMRWILLWNMSLAQDRSLDLLASSPACYRCTMDAPSWLALSNSWYIKGGKLTYFSLDIAWQMLVLYCFLKMFLNCFSFKS